MVRFPLYHTINRNLTPNVLCSRRSKMLQTETAYSTWARVEGHKCRWNQELAIDSSSPVPQANCSGRAQNAPKPE